MPYSDNLYSMVDEDDSDVEAMPDYGGHLDGGEPGDRQATQTSQASRQSHGQEHEQDEGSEHVLSPVTSTFTSSEDGEARTPSNQPRVPNVMVRDPTLEPGTTAESKAQEARQERLANEELAQEDEPTVDALPRLTSPVRPSSARQTMSSTSGRSISTANYQPSMAAYFPSESRSASSSSYTSHPPGNIYTHRSPLVATEAPPAYTPSPSGTDTSSSSPLTTSHGFSNNYQTFQSALMGRSDETQRLLAGPQSMGGPSHSEDVHAASTWKDRVRHRAVGKGCRVASIALLLALVTAGFLSAAVRSVRHQTPHPQPDEPSGRPSKGVQPPSMDYPAYDGDIPWFPTNAWCSGTPKHHIQLSEQVTFSARKSFSFLQDVPHHDDNDNQPQYHPVQVRGDVVLRRSGRDTPESSIILEYITNDDTLKLEVDWDDDLQQYRVTVPRKLPWDGSVSWPCVAIRVNIWVPDDGVINELSVSTVQLNIALLDNLSIQVKKALMVAAVSGTVSAATDGTAQGDDLINDAAPDSFRLESPWIEARSISGTISGNWPLFDYLGISTISGDIKVHIDPKEGNEQRSNPAVLNIKTNSGTVEFRQPISKATASSVDAVSIASSQPITKQLIPPRDYRPNIQSTSGTIRGSLAFSSVARIHTISGTTEVELLPVLSIEDADSHARPATPPTSKPTAPRERCASVSWNHSGSTRTGTTSRL